MKRGSPDRFGMNPLGDDILQRLGRIRTTVRRRLLAFGLCAVLAGGCLSFFTVVTLDWLLDLPPQLRVFGAVLFVTGAGVASLHWIIRPLQVRFTLPQIAGRLEQHYPGLKDRLTSTVSFITSEPIGSEALRTQVIANTHRILGRLQLERALTVRPLLVQMGILGGAVILAFAIVVSSPQWVSVGARRYLRPFEPLDWPRSVQIEPLTRTVRAALGDSVSVSMRIVKGDRADLRGIVHLIDAAGRRSSLSMRRGPDLDYHCDINAITSSLVYWFEAGDADTRRAPGHIELVQRPAVSHAEATVHPPPYAEYAPSVVTDPTAGPIQAVVGSRVHLRLHTTKLIRTDPSGRPEAWIEFAGGRREMLDFVDDDTRRLEATFAVERSDSLSIHLVDRRGMSGSSGQPYAVDVSPDQPPTVTMLDPESSIETTANGTVAIRVRAEDDFGLSDIRLVASLDDSTPGAEILLPLNADSIAPGRRGVVAVSEYEWALAPMRLTPPASVVYHIRATDNRVTNEATGQLGVSPSMRIKIVAKSDFEERLRDAFAAIERHVRQVWLDQQSVKDDTVRIQDSMRTGEAPDGRANDRTASVIHRQIRLEQDVRRLAGQFERVGAKMRAAGVADRGSIDETERLHDVLTETADSAMRRAVEALESASSPPVGRERGNPTADVQIAAEKQRDAIESLHGVLQRMNRWRGFAGLMQKARDLADRQADLETDTAELGRRTVGRRVDELGEEDRSELQTLSRRQRQLAEAFDVFVNRLRDEARDKAASDQAAAAAIEDALRAVAAADVQQRMRQAADDIEDNRMNSAGVHQRSARLGLSRMLAGLENRDTRQLILLVKRAEEALRVVTRLLEKQTQLLKATREADDSHTPPDALAVYGRDQERLERNTAALAEMLRDAIETADAADALIEAADAMERAKDALVDNRVPDAEVVQEQAVVWLRDAHDKLEHRAREAAQAAFNRMLAALQTQLQDVHQRQSEINARTAEITDEYKQKGRLDRGTVRRAAAAALSQGEVRSATEEIAGRLTRSVVYKHVLSGVLDEMNVSRESLDARRLDERLAAAQGSILRHLEQLIRALEDVRRLPPSDEFVTGLEGSEGGPSVGAAPKIPSAAELLMLKTMQADLMADTAVLAATLPDETPRTEAELEAVETLGVRQHELQTLTETVVQPPQGNN